jgi:hypothetical protein
MCREQVRTAVMEFDEAWAKGWTSVMGWASV